MGMTDTEFAEFKELTELEKKQIQSQPLRPEQVQRFCDLKK